MDKLEIELGHDEKEDSFYHAWGFRTDEKYFFFMMKVIIAESFG